MKLFELIQLLASSSNDPNSEVVLETKEGDEIDINDVQFKRCYTGGRVVLESKGIVLRSTHEDTLEELSNANDKISQLESELESRNA
jgi:hypothetical protein